DRFSTRCCKWSGRGSSFGMMELVQNYSQERRRANQRVADRRMPAVIIRGQNSLTRSVRLTQFWAK
ncbi:MAG: hypothetical protein KDA85_03685, partial [Planctomycetaceae bacterium]|nr:hypothetical protein [Planctomycetaceae bacterium]